MTRSWSRQTATTPRDRCLQAVRSVVSTGDAGAIGLAEKAIDDFVGSQRDLAQQIDALEHLKPSLLPGRDAIAGPRL